MRDQRRKHVAHQSQGPRRNPQEQDAQETSDPDAARTAFARGFQDEHVDQVVVEHLFMVVEQRRGVLKLERAEEVKRYVKMMVQAKRTEVPRTRDANETEPNKKVGIQRRLGTKILCFRGKRQWTRLLGKAKQRKQMRRRTPWTRTEEKLDKCTEGGRR